ncbi:MAG TPA: DUF5808 domain-containing protein [Pedobacter sp.]|jgi:uncharacterized membrane protein|nr:DUF5808 domain-containing protein [Pedobacter sp.]
MDFFKRLKLYFTTQNTGKDFEHEKPENWVFGIFYFNSKDYRFILPKRNQMMGWTFNFAHPISYIVLALILLVAILSSLNT